MFLAAREVLHGCAIAFVRERAQIHLEAFQSVLDARLVDAFAEHAVSFGMVYETLQGFRRAGPGYQQVEIADGVLAAAETAGGGELLQAASLFQIWN